MSATVLHGDCRDLMRSLPEAHFDACVTDPPYELGFMGKEWDRRGVAFDPATWAAVLRALKPGAHLLAFGGTRTWHRIACAIEDAGFEVRDTVMWMYGTGFPKSHDVSKAIDKAAGAEREVVEQVRVKGGGMEHVNRSNAEAHGYRPDGYQKGENVLDITAPATDAARQWQGWGTALKPAWEPIIVARKPLIGTVAENVLAHGAGAINVDGCRIGTTDKLGGGAETITRPGQKTNDGWTRPWMEDPHAQAAHAATVRGNVAKAEELGRWPANVIHDGSDEVLAAFAAYGDRGAAAPVRGDEPSPASEGNVTGRRARVAGVFHGDTGTAARFFYSAKASKADRAGSKHPTVKPVALMRYLCRLVTPPGGRILDPFAGSGTTGQAALEEGFTPTLIEAEAEYVADIQRRLAIQEATRAACAPTEERQGVLL